MRSTPITHGFPFRRRSNRRPLPTPWCEVVREQSGRDRQRRRSTDGARAFVSGRQARRRISEAAKRAFDRPTLPVGRRQEARVRPSSQDTIGCRSSRRAPQPPEVQRPQVVAPAIASRPIRIVTPTPAQPRPLPVAPPQVSLGFDPLADSKPPRDRQRNRRSGQTLALAAAGVCSSRSQRARDHRFWPRRAASGATRGRID